MTQRKWNNFSEFENDKSHNSMFDVQEYSMLIPRFFSLVNSFYLWIDALVNSYYNSIFRKFNINFISDKSISVDIMKYQSQLNALNNFRSFNFVQNCLSLFALFPYEFTCITFVCNSRKVVGSNRFWFHLRGSKGIKITLRRRNDFFSFYKCAPFVFTIICEYVQRCTMVWTTKRKLHLRLALFSNTTIIIYVQCVSIGAYCLLPFAHTL